MKTIFKTLGGKMRKVLSVIVIITSAIILTACSGADTTAPGENKAESNSSSITQSSDNSKEESVKENEEASSQTNQSSDQTTTQTVSEVPESEAQKDLLNLDNDIFRIENGKLIECYKIEGDIVIPEGVTHIGDKAFYRGMKVTSITIPEGVVSIGDWSFDNCTRITELKLPESLTSIGQYAFNGCLSLTELTIPDNVTSIGMHAFISCDYITVNFKGVSYTQSDMVANKLYAAING